MSWVRAAGLLVMLGVARSAAAEPFTTRAGTSGALDVPDSEAALLGTAGFAAEVRLLRQRGGAWALSPSATLGLGLNFGLEVGFWLREDGAPGDPTPSPLLIAGAVKLHLIDARAWRPGLAVETTFDRLNLQPVPGARVVGSTEVMKPLQLMAFVGGEYLSSKRIVTPTAGLAAVVTYRERFSLVLEAAYGLQDNQVGAALRWRITENFGTSFNVTHLPRAGETLYTLAIWLRTSLPVKKQAELEEEAKVEEKKPAVAGPVKFLDERPRFRLKVKLNAVPAEERATGRHTQYAQAPTAPEEAPAPVEPQAPPPPAPVPAPPPPAVVTAPKKYSLVVVMKDRIEIKKQIRFASGSAKIIGALSKQILDEVGQALQDNPQIEHVRIEGHTDSDGSDAYNLKLSQDRANAVMLELLKRNVDPGRMKAIGFGEGKPIASNLTAAGKAQNRRTEFNTGELPVAAAPTEPTGPTGPVAPTAQPVAQVIVRAPDGTPTARPAQERLLVVPAGAAKPLTPAQRNALKDFAKAALAKKQELHIEARAPVSGGSLVEASRRAEEVEAALRKAGLKPGVSISVEIVRSPANTKVEVLVYALGSGDGGGVAVPVASPTDGGLPIAAAVDAGVPPTMDELIAAAVDAKVRTVMRDELRAALAELFDAGQLVAARVDAGQPAAVRVDAGQPVAVRVDAGQPAVVRVDAGQPPAVRVDAGQPVAVRVDAGPGSAPRPDAGPIVELEVRPRDAGGVAALQPDAGRREVGQPDAGRPDAGAPDAGRIDARGTETRRADAGQPESRRIDAGATESRRADAGQPEAERLDAGQPRAGTPDAGRFDRGAPDAGRPGAGPLDAGQPDAGNPDAGTLTRLLPGEAGQAQLRTTLVSHTADIRRCAEHQLKRTPTLKASGVLILTVDKKGRVSKAIIEEGKLSHTYFEDCLRAEAASWRFPAGEAPYDLEVPLNVLGIQGSK